jgi:DivIVA domain-containing protein
MLPEDVVNKRFDVAKFFREGYAMDEVDDFLDETVAELRRLQKEEMDLRLARSRGALPFASSPILTPEDVVNKRFGQTKFREGYNQDQVDDFLDEIVVELRRLSVANAATRTEAAKLIEETS